MRYARATIWKWETVYYWWRQFAMAREDVVHPRLRPELHREAAFRDVTTIFDQKQTKH